MILTIVVFIIVLSLLVFVHELGHFYTARKMGMKVEEFGFGYPPAIFKIKKGETEYSLNWIPIGGFVKIKGEDGEMRDQEDSFAHKKPWQRIVVLAAGVTMNFLLAAACLGIGFMMGLPQAINQDISGKAMISQQKIQIAQVMPDSPADKAELEAGDVIATVNGEEVERYDDILGRLNSQSKGIEFDFQIKRGEETINKTIATTTIEDGRTLGIGVGLVETGIVKYPWYLAIYKGFEVSVQMVVLIVVTFAAIIKNLIVGQPIGVEVAGPVGIAALTGQFTQMGFVYLLQFIAILSLNLAVINILPFPPLDGARIVFVLLEKIRNKPVSQKIEGLVNLVGFAVLMLLVLVVTVQDIGRYSGGIMDFFKNLIS